MEDLHLLSPEVGVPKLIVLEEEKVKSPGRVEGAFAVGILWVLRWVILGESRAFIDSERGSLDGEREGAGVMSETGLVDAEKLTCLMTVGER